MTETRTHLSIAGRELTLIGTAHVSRESIEEVVRVVREIAPDRLCVELDAARYASMTEQETWDKLDIAKVIKDGRGFLLMANLALSSFQKRLGQGLGVKPGDEMKIAIQTATELGIPYALCDRDVQTTLKRAWGKCGFWAKNKLLAALISSAFSTEKIEEKDIEALKNKNELDGMMAELADYLPTVKETLIDERDRYLASKIWTSSGTRLVAVIGAGHLEGVRGHLERIATGAEAADISDLEVIPPPSALGKAAGWIIPLAIVALIGAGFFRAGAGVSLDMLLRWMLLNGSLAALGTVIALGHPVSVLVSFFGAPIATLNPLIGVGLFAGVAEATLRKPRVADVQRLSEDITHLKSFYGNRVTRALLVFLLSSVGGMIGNFISIPYLTSLVVK